MERFSKTVDTIHQVGEVGSKEAAGVVCCVLEGGRGQVSRGQRTLSLAPHQWHASVHGTPLEQCGHVTRGERIDTPTSAAVVEMLFQEMCT